MSISNKFGINPSELRSSGSNKLTYIIRSPPTGLNKDIYLSLNGLTSRFNYFDCKVQGFYTNFVSDPLTQNGLICELKCNGASFVNGVDGNRNLNTMAITTMNNDYVNEPYQFRVANFNNTPLNFQLVNEKNELFVNTNNVNQIWILILNMEGVEDSI